MLFPQEFIPYMAEQYGFQYELVQYKWPRWLHQQTEKQRIIWGYKILFLDVLFPLSVDKFLFVDADQVHTHTLWMSMSLICVKAEKYSFLSPPTDSAYRPEGAPWLWPWRSAVWLHTVLWEPERDGRLPLLEVRLLGQSPRWTQISHQVTVCVW